MELASKRPINSDDALQRLVIGNQQFSSGSLKHPRQTAQTRMEVASGQRPFAAILGCSDARIPPEIIFDQGLGDLYVIRVAGNVVDALVLGGLEYAVEDLGVPLIVVLGHDRCGAIATAVQMMGFSPRASAPGAWTWQHGWQPVRTLPVGHLSNLAISIKPAVDRAYQKEGNLVDNAINANISYVVDELKASQPILMRYVKERGLRIVGARYNLTSGVVNFVG